MFPATASGETWVNAENECLKLGGHLACLDEAEEFTLLLNLTMGNLTFIGTCHVIYIKRFAQLCFLLYMRIIMHEVI